MTTHVYESCLIPFGIARVWNLIRGLNFSFLVGVTSVKSSHSATVGSEYEFKYKDDTVQIVKVLGVSDAHYRIRYQLVKSEPPVSVLSAIHSIRLHRVSWDPRENRAVDHTVAILTSDFSMDVTQSVLQDAKWKKRELVDGINRELKGLAKNDSQLEPNFTGLWRSVRSENLKGFLKSQGFQDEAIQKAEKQEMIQAIKQTPSYFRVSSNGHLYSYLVGANINSIQSSGNMVWDGDTLVSTSDTDNKEGQLITRRLMVGKELCVVMQNSEQTCKRFFEYVPAEKQDERMKAALRQVFTVTDDYRME